MYHLFRYSSPLYSPSSSADLLNTIIAEMSHYACNFETANILCDLRSWHRMCTAQNKQEFFTKWIKPSSLFRKCLSKTVHRNWGIALLLPVKYSNLFLAANSEWNNFLRIRHLYTGWFKRYLSPTEKYALDSTCKKKKKSIRWVTSGDNLLTSLRQINISNIQ